jgi:hypothetical protein
LIYQVFGFTGIFACCGALQLRLGLTERVGNSRGGLVSGIRRSLFAAIKSRTGLAYGMFGSLRIQTSLSSHGADGSLTKALMITPS